MAFIVVKTLALYGFWLLLSGKLTPFHLAAGLLSAFTIVWLNSSPKSRQQSQFQLTKSAGLVWRFILYSGWLMKSIFLAAWHVTEIILNPKMPIDPKIIRHKTVLQKNGARVIFANSITLTPGTITADFDGDTFIIHELDEASAGDIVSGGMEEHIVKIFGGTKA